MTPRTLSSQENRVRLADMSQRSWRSFDSPLGAQDWRSFLLDLARTSWYRVETMPTSAQRDAQPKTVAADPARGRARGAARNPPGPALPTMAPPPELVVLQCKMQAHGKPASNSSAAAAPIQLKINGRLNTKWYRRKGNSNSSKVNILIEDYNATNWSERSVEERLDMLAAIEAGLQDVNPAKTTAIEKIRAEIASERAEIQGSNQSLPAQVPQSDLEDDQDEDDEQDEQGPLGNLPNDGRPISMQQLVALNDMQIDTLIEDTSVKGPLMGILKGAFEANWFKAKDCLVFEKWPEQFEPRFSHKSALALMTALTILRGNVHKMIMPLAQQEVYREILKRSLQVQKGSPSLAMHLMDDGATLHPDEQVQYKGSVGADTVTSDVDVSTGGKNSELAVRAYNEAFRDALDVDFDPGTVFDLNVYSMDFVHGSSTATVNGRLNLNVNAEHPDVQIDEQSANERDEEQEIWSLVHIARYMPDEAEWNQFALHSSAFLPKAQQKRQARMLTKARSRAQGFEDRLQSMMAHLEDHDEGLRDALNHESSWGDADARHYGLDALRMRAANRLYEDKLLQVKQLRARIAELKQKNNRTDEENEELQKAVKQLPAELSMAQLYGNEVYGSGGATVHAVYGMQTKRKLEKDREKNPDGLPVDVKLTAAQWFEAFNDNLGDVLKDYQHFATKHGSHAPDYWYAAFKMGKYVNRLLDCLRSLAQMGLLAPNDAQEIAQSPEVAVLGELAEHHLNMKDDVGGTDPTRLTDRQGAEAERAKALNENASLEEKQRLAKRVAGVTYFSSMNASKVAAIKCAALWLGGDVRRKVARKKAN